MNLLWISHLAVQDEIAAAASRIKDRSVLIYVMPLNDFLNDALRSIKGTFFKTLVFVRQLLRAIANQIMLFAYFTWNGYLQIAFGFQMKVWQLLTCC